MIRKSGARWFISLLFSMVLLSSCGASRLEQYNHFAIQCAKAGLWREATFRWKQVLELSPNHAPAHNNLGVAYEAIGEFDNAIAAYDNALQLEPDNRTYELNRARCLTQKSVDPESVAEN